MKFLKINIGTVYNQYCIIKKTVMYTLKFGLPLAADKCNLLMSLF